MASGATAAPYWAVAMQLSARWDLTCDTVEVVEPTRIPTLPLANVESMAAALFTPSSSSVSVLP
jgi:hypothetical protein